MLFILVKKNPKRYLFMLLTVNYTLDDTKATATKTKVATTTITSSPEADRTTEITVTAQDGVTKKANITKE